MKEETRLEGPFEFGEKPMQRNSKTDWDKVRKLAEENKMEEIPSDIYIKYVHNLEHIANSKMIIPARTSKKECLWLHGKPGCGKTKFATFKWPKAYKKLQNKWWDGYQGHEAVLLDDLGAENAKHLTTHLKLWADPWNN